MSAGEPRLLHVFSTFDPGGPQVRAVRLFGRMPPAWKNTVVAMDGRTGALEALAPEERPALAALPRGKGLLGQALRCLRLLRALAPDLVLTYNWGAIETVLAAWWAGLPVVHHEDGFGPEEFERFLARRVAARRLLLPRIPAVAVPSRTLLGVARGRWRIPGERLFWLPNGVDPDRFRPAGTTAGTELVIGSIGGLRPEKDQAVLLEALAACACRGRARLRLIGEGPERPALEARAARLGLAERVELPGAVRETAPHYRGFDLFALSSRTEQMPIVLLEAMASGLAVAATRVGDVAEMVAPQNLPFLVERNDPAGLARAIDRLAADPALRAAVGAANRERVRERYDEARCLDRFVWLYRRALEGGRGA